MAVAKSSKVVPDVVEDTQSKVNMMRHNPGPVMVYLFMDINKKSVTD